MCVLGGAPSLRVRGDRSAHPSLSLGPHRVRSIIMLQEKAQDRERLLLKFIKIMKVTEGTLLWEARAPHPCHLPSRLPCLYAAFTEIEQL